MASSSTPQKPEDNWDDWSDDALKAGTAAAPASAPPPPAPASPPASPVAAAPPAASPPAPPVAAGAVAQNAGAGTPGDGDDWFNELFTEESSGSAKASAAPPAGTQGDWPAALFGESPQSSESGSQLFSSVAGTAQVSPPPVAGPAPTVTKEKRGKGGPKPVKAPKSSNGSQAAAGSKVFLLVGLVLVVVVVGIGGFEFKHFLGKKPAADDTVSPPSPRIAGVPNGPGAMGAQGSRMPPLPAGAPGTHMPPGAPGSMTAGVHMPPGGPSAMAPGVHMAPVSSIPGAATAGVHLPPTTGAAASVSTAPSISDADYKSTLKALWNRGAEAKHTHNNYQAKVFWSDGLRRAMARPGFEQSVKGFQESLQHLNDPA